MTRAEFLNSRSPAKDEKRARVLCPSPPPLVRYRALTTDFFFLEISYFKCPGTS